MAIGSSLINDQVPEHGEPTQSRPIGGWLVIPAISLSLGILTSALGICFGIYMLLRADQETFADMRVWALLIIELAVLVYAIYAAALFFSKRREAIRAMIILMAAGIVAGTGTTALLLSLSGEASTDAIKPLLRSFVVAAIWIPYFLMSKRVRETFTR